MGWATSKGIEYKHSDCEMMISFTGIAIGSLIFLLGWYLFSNPQKMFWLSHFPLVPSGSDGLTEDGEPVYQLRAMYIMGLGLVFVVLSIVWG